MSEDLIDLPLGDDEDDFDPSFPSEDPLHRPVEHSQRPAKKQDRHRGGSRRHSRRPAARRRKPIWLLLLVPFLVLAAWLYWRPSRLEVFPEQLATLKVAVGTTSEPAEIEIINAGRREVVLEDIRVADSEVFSIGERDCGETVLAGESCHVQVVFSPTAMGSAAARVEIVGSQRGGVTEVEIPGEGLGARMVADKSRIDFGSTSVDGRSAVQLVEVSNRGTLAGSLGRVSIGGDSDFRLTDNGCRDALEPGERCRLQLVFSPRRMGARDARLTAEGKVAEPMSAIELVGQGIGPGFEIDPASLDFGEWKVGSTSTAMGIRWLNRGDVEWTLSTPVLDGSGFSLVSDTCTRSPIPAGGSCGARVTFAPQGAGAVKAALHLVHRGGERFPAAQLTGVGTAANLEFDLRKVGFAATPVGRTSPPRTVRLTNSGSATASIRSVRLDGGTASSFRLQSDCGSELSPGATCVLRLQMEPKSSGSVSSSLKVESDAPKSPTVVALEGNGAAAKLVLSRDRIDFSTVPQGESQDLQIAIQNAGSAPLDLPKVTIEGSGFGVRGDDCSSRMIVSGADCEIVVRFQPKNPGAHVGALVVHSAVGERRIPLSGLAGAPPVPRASVDRSSIDFETTGAGSRSPAETLTLISHGPGRLEIWEIVIDGEGSGAFRLVPATCQNVPHLFAGSRCTVGIRFQPSTTGEHSGTVTIRTNAEPARIRIALRGQSPF